MDVRRDYYAVLGLEPHATAREIRRAFRTLVRRYHPDASSQADGTDEFQRVQEAYEILSDPEQRQAYDRWREKEGLANPPAVAVRQTLSYEALPLLDEDQMLYVLVDITPNTQLKAERLPLNLCLVLDRSTSMQGARLQRVKEAANNVIENLEREDTFSLVAFSDRAEVIIPAQASIDKPLARSRVSTIRTSGGTEILQGMLTGLAEIDRFRSSGMANQLVLLTDGQTYGDEEGCIEQATLAARRQISITTMGIGQDWNDHLLDEIARRSGGTSRYIDSASRVTASLRSYMQDLATVIGRDLRLTLVPADDVRVHKVFRVSPYMEALRLAGDTVSLGQLSGSQPLSVLLEFVVDADRGGRMRVAQLDLAADVPSISAEEQRVRRDVEINVVDGLELSDLPPPHIVSLCGKLAIFEMQEKTMRDLEANELERASQRLETMATRLLNIGENELAKAALLEAGRLSRTGRLSPEGRKRIRYGTRSLSLLPKEVVGGPV